MASRQFVTHSSDETIERGRELGKWVKAPTLILLSGDLGAGKTTMTKGIVSGIGAGPEEEVTSPTFTLVHKYGDRTPVYHVDLYRIDGSRDFDSLGLEDLFAERAIVIVEWSEKFKMLHEWPILRIHLEHVDQDSRRITVEGLSD
jgi:tRNA threonylcarbamoyladenosine biosynthesis protein TsaE